MDIDTSNCCNNNLNRHVIDKNYAKYRCDKAFVINIYYKYSNGKKEEIAFISSDYDPNFVYTKISMFMQINIMMMLMQYAQMVFIFILLNKQHIFIIFLHILMVNIKIGITMID